MDNADIFLSSQGETGKGHWEYEVMVVAGMGGKWAWGQEEDSTSSVRGMYNILNFAQTLVNSYLTQVLIRISTLSAPFFSFLFSRVILCDLCGHFEYNKPIFLFFLNFRYALMQVGILIRKKQAR